LGDVAGFELLLEAASRIPLMNAAGQKPVTESERLIIRQLRIDDGHAMYGIFGDAQVMRYSDGPKTRQWVDGWLREHVDDHYKDWGFGMWAVVERRSGDVIGYCGLSRFKQRCGPRETEIGYRLVRSHWGHGLATEAVCAVRDYAIKTLRLGNLIAIIDPQNIASLRVAEKAGFRYDREIMFEGYTHPDKVFILEGHNC
jgi:ribosomal-protein-alanine N-acetyltransferase